MSVTQDQRSRFLFTATPRMYGTTFVVPVPPAARARSVRAMSLVRTTAATALQSASPPLELAWQEPLPLAARLSATLTKTSAVDGAQVVTTITVPATLNLASVASAGGSGGPTRFQAADGGTHGIGDGTLQVVGSGVSSGIPVATAYNGSTTVFDITPAHTSAASLHLFSPPRHPTAIVLDLCHQLAGTQVATGLQVLQTADGGGVELRLSSSARHTLDVQFAGDATDLARLGLRASPMRIIPKQSLTLYQAAATATAATPVELAAQLAAQGLVTLSAATVFEFADVNGRRHTLEWPAGEFTFDGLVAQFNALMPEGAGVAATAAADADARLVIAAADATDRFSLAVPVPSQLHDALGLLDAPTTLVASIETVAHRDCGTTRWAVDIAADARSVKLGARVHPPVAATLHTVNTFTVVDPGTTAARPHGLRAGSAVRVMNGGKAYAFRVVGTTRTTVTLDAPIYMDALDRLEPLGAAALQTVTFLGGSDARTRALGLFGLNPAEVFSARRLALLPALPRRLLVAIVDSHLSWDFAQVAVGHNGATVGVLGSLATNRNGAVVEDVAFTPHSPAQLPASTRLAEVTLALLDGATLERVAVSPNSVALLLELHLE